ncbi:MAG TPA: PorP/SprF family type IX secretion system membrane protein [Bacteroidia bacterium]|jgi:type IX secretion system PorP/SprF family membrane protein|nr:PorP/SprF family type IX secretion system membrane protein [Bacteroidia bacterium]
MKQKHQALLKTIFIPVFGLLFLFGSLSSCAQDFHLSQYDASPLFLNPAMTGMFDGKFRAHVHYRNQWSSVSTKPFTTAGISADMPVKKFGIGAQLMNFRAGAGSYNALSALLSFSYDLASKTNMHHLAIGIQMGLIQKSIRPDQLFFGNQYDAANGGGFDLSIPSNEVFKASSFIIPALNAGLLYYFAKSNARLNPFIGFSVFNLTEPEERFLTASGSKLPMRFNLHGGIKINVNERIQLLPKFIYTQQSDNQEITGSLILHYFMKDANTFLLFGPTYRVNDAAIIEAGIKKNACTIRISYDVNTSPLKSISYYRGGFEASITYVFAKPKPAPVVNCPRL